MAAPCLNADVTAWIDRLARVLDPRCSWRLLPIVSGLLFATGRRTVSSWLAVFKFASAWSTASGPAHSGRATPD